MCVLTVLQSELWLAPVPALPVGPLFPGDLEEGSLHYMSQDVAHWHLGENDSGLERRLSHDPESDFPTLGPFKIKQSLLLVK